MSLPPAATPSEERSSAELPDSELPPRWYVVAFVVSVAMAVLPLALGLILTFAGNAVGACSNEMGCVYFYVVGLCVAPLAFIFGAIASGLKARRLASENASRARIWKEGFRVGFVALMLAGLLTMPLLAALC